MRDEPKPLRHRSLIAAVITAVASAALLSSLAARVRLFRRPPDEDAASDLPLPLPVPSVELLTSGAENRSRFSRSWMIAAVIGLGTLGTLFLPSPWAAVALLLVLLASAMIVALDSGLNPSRILGSHNQRSFADGEPDVGSSLVAFALANRRVLTPVFMLITLLCLGAAAHLLSPAVAARDKSGALVLVALGGVLFGLAMLLARQRDTVLVPTDAPFFPRYSSGLSVSVGALLLAVATAMNIRLFGLEVFVKATTHAQFIFWLLGIVLVGWGLAGAPRLRLPRVSWSDAAIVLLIGVAALAVRVYQLDTAVHASVDEVHYMDGVRFLREDASFRLLAPGSSYLPITMLSPYVNYVVIQLVGQSSLASLRLTEAIVGTLNVLAVYGLCRALFNRPVALAAGLIMVGFAPHIHFSRIAMAHITDTLFGTLTLMFITRGLKTNRRADWVLGGICFGLTQYFFEGGRLLFPPVVFVWTVLLLLTQRRRLPQLGRGYAVCALAALFTIAPVYFTVYALDIPRTSRFSDSGMSEDYLSSLTQDGFDGSDASQLLRRFSDPFLMYISRTEGSTQYFGGDQPLLMTVFVPFFLVGVFYLLWHWRAPSVVIVIWMTGTALGNSLLSDPFQSPRYVNVMPALAICVALGLCYSLSLLFGSGRTTGRRTATLVVVASAAISVFTISYYFGPQLRMFNVQFREAKDYNDAVDALLRVVNVYPRGTNIVVISDPQADYNVPAQTLNFMANQQYRFQTKHSNEVNDDFFAELPRNVGTAFFIDAADARMLDLIQRHFWVRPPQYSLNEYLPASREYILLYAPARPGSS